MAFRKKDMSITDCIQDVKEDIAEQRNEMDLLRAKRIGLMGIFLGALTMFSVNLLLLTPSLGYTVPFGLVTIIAGFHWNLVHKEVVQIRKLLSQNMFYRDLIIAETYAGENSELDQL